ncbi:MULTISPECIES: hypothetical protein [unclassified Streptomyces]|uniref:hypothetical protein n=1 Tax=unclassified Streptomyces TaxID=2593676 RepID=UPI0029A3CD4E|nr:MULTISPECIES: hypothetical protein [unclassified Streptomyces]MDX3771659.1 hypothetical protein [Streptomyces sp. AK08-01B]MDX3821296.1 hypothetical protein [Streptomyces sp. AK08-01A]
MRLRTLRRQVRRTWTVELRPQQGGTVLYCALCAPCGLALAGSAARPAVLAHLAHHARRDLLPPHLRTCQCHERGCRWHPRHRGCAGPVLLVLARERGGRLWRLADVCAACAGATPGSAVVPDTSIASISARPDARSGSAEAKRATLPDGAPPAHRVRDMLSYLAATLPPEASAEGRLLALQCALRSNTSGQVHLQAGLLRGMRLARTLAPWEELEDARWLRRLPLSAEQMGQRTAAAQLLDATVLTQEPARHDRNRAADWALRAISRPRLRALPAADRLTALLLTVHYTPDAGRTSMEADHLTRTCGLDRNTLTAALDRLLSVNAVGAWTFEPVTEDVSWDPPRK